MSATVFLHFLLHHKGATKIFGVRWKRRNHSSWADDATGEAHSTDRYMTTKSWNTCSMEAKKILRRRGTRTRCRSRAVRAFLEEEGAAPAALDFSWPPLLFTPSVKPASQPSSQWSRSWSQRSRSRSQRR
ncbi:uncharacterized protein LOC135074591 [Ostrinia nubilalis]|uniref:uncharacterized protein LOC135074591 n=1 Tax=Ostrinia nubilalis TaxID=29057 RepID=UPI003082216C